MHTFDLAVDSGSEPEVSHLASEYPDDKTDDAHVPRMVAVFAVVFSIPQKHEFAREATMPKSSPRGAMMPATFPSVHACDLVRRSPDM